MSAAGRAGLRASDADREQVIGTLKAAFARGVLAKDEFDLRASQAFASRTYASWPQSPPAFPPSRPQPSRPLRHGTRAGSQFCGPAG
ncbi:MAG: DUF1707 domain-containing protein [Actinomycetota bacterium]|nr:DUF1707 domain-containing protein [Actinomycetota bacterium]